MTWKYPSWEPPVAQPWHGVTNILDFVSAVVERSCACSGGPPSQTGIDGAEIWDALMGVASWTGPQNAQCNLYTWTGTNGWRNEGHHWIWYLQNWIESNFNKFVVSHSAGESLGAGYYDGRADIPTYVNLAAVFSAAGLATSTWRAYIEDPNNLGAEDKARKIDGNERDIIGPWLFEDLQAVLKVLVWVLHDSVFAEDEDNKYYQAIVNPDAPPTWVAAKAAAEAIYADTGGIAGTPLAVTSGRAESIPPEFGGGAWYGAYMDRTQGKPSATVFNFAKSIVELYIKPIQSYFTTFDGYGDFAAGDEDTFVLVETANNTDGDDDPTSVSVVATAVFGNVTAWPSPSPWCDEPPADGQIWRGYKSTMKAVARYDVTGGFVYV